MDGERPMRDARLREARELDGADCLPPEWQDGIDALRAESPVRDAWRAEVLRAVRAAPAPRAHASSHRPWRIAAAAAAAGFVLGAGAMRIVERDGPARIAAPPVPSAAAVHAASDAAALRMPVRFVVLAPSARSVALVGEFNGWDPSAMPMRRSADGTWRLEASLEPGRHRYGFLVDGRLVADPGAPLARDDDFGVGSSIILVTRPST